METNNTNEIKMNTTTNNTNSFRGNIIEDLAPGGLFKSETAEKIKPEKWEKEKKGC